MIDFLALKLEADVALRKARRALALSYVSLAVALTAFALSLFNLVTLWSCPHG